MSPLILACNCAEQLAALDHRITLLTVGLFILVLIIVLILLTS